MIEWLQQLSTQRLLTMLARRGERKRFWEDQNSYHSYTDGHDERMIDDIAEVIADRIDAAGSKP